MGTTLVSKGFVVATVLVPSINYDYMTTSVTTTTIVVFCSMFLPGLLLTLMSLCRYNYKDCVKNIPHHPSLLLLPIFTHFTFSSNRKYRSKREETKKEGVRETMVTFSRNWTLVNIGLSVVGHIT